MTLFLLDAGRQFLDLNALTAYHVAHIDLFVDDVDVNPDPLTRHDPALDDDFFIVQHQFQRSRIHGVGGDDRRRTSTDIIRTSLTTSFRTRTRWRGHHSVSTSSCSSERVTSVSARAACWSLATVPLSRRPQRDRPCRVDPRPGGGVCTD